MLPAGTPTARLLLDSAHTGSVIVTPTVPFLRLPSPTGSWLYPSAPRGFMVGEGKHVDLPATNADPASPFQWRLRFALSGVDVQPETVEFNAEAGTVVRLADLVAGKPTVYTTGN